MAGEGLSKVCFQTPLYPQFFDWLFHLGTHAKLLDFKRVVGEHRTYLGDTSALYGVDQGLPSPICADK